VTRAAGAAALALAAAAAGCNPSVHPSGGGPPEFTIGEIDLELVSGAAVETLWGWRLFLTDQLDACDAVAFVPNGLHTILELRVAPAAGGAEEATVVSPVATPGPGEAAGGIRQANALVERHAYDAADGTVAWTAEVDGSVTIDTIDVGFAGVAGRVATGALHLARCNL
jgi:hypothetical protein